MTDTIRSRDDILALFADNIAGDISAQNARDMVVSLHGVYGALTCAGASAAQSLGTTEAKLTAWTANGASAGTTPDHTADQIVVGTAGIYMVWIVLQGTGANSTTYTFNPAVDGTLQTAFQVINTTVNTGTWTVSLVALLALTAGQAVSVYGRASATQNYTMNNGQLVVYRIA